MTKAKLPPGVRIRPDGRYEQRITLDGARLRLRPHPEGVKGERRAAAEARAGVSILTRPPPWYADWVQPELGLTTSTQFTLSRHSGRAYDHYHTMTESFGLMRGCSAGVWT